MKILQINATYHNSGSTDRIEQDLKKVLESHGHDSYIAYGYDGVVDNDNHVRGFQGKWQRKWNILRCRLWPRHGFYSIHETRRLLNWIDKIRPDVIHLHNIHNHYVNVRMLFDYIKSHDIPVVWTLHDCWSFTGWCTYFDYAHCENWKSGCHDCPNKHEYPYTWLFDLSKSNYRLKKDAFLGVKSLLLITPSQWLADLTRHSYLKEYPVKVVHNGINTEIFKPCSTGIKEILGIEGKKMILAIASGFSKRKGIDYLVQLPDYLGEDEVLVIVGLSAKQKEFVPKNKKCIAIGRTKNPRELAEYYSAANVFINPTLEDNFPTTNIEALACGTPVVTFRTGGSVESVTKDTGIIVEQGNIRQLVEGIRRICSLPNKFQTSKCVEWANAYCDKNKQYMKYIEIYKSLNTKKE